MSNMNGPTRKKFYYEMVCDEGEYCKWCKVSGKEKQLVIDHKDNDNSNNQRKNRQFLCRPCNYIKNPRRPVDECVSEDENPTEISINRTKEPCFRKYAYQRMDEEGEIYESDLRDSGAEHCEVSSEATRKYLKKMSSSEGKFQRVRRINGWTIRYKPNNSER